MALFGGLVEHYDNFYTNEESDVILDYLKTLYYNRTYYYMYGKVTESPRLMKWFCDDPSRTYVFSRSHINGLAPEPFTPELNKIKHKIEDITGQKFNALLINKYQTGSDKIAWHSDNDAWCGDKFVVPSLSFGATRKFQLRQKTDHKIKISYDLTHGSLIVMKDDCQTHLEHAILAQKTVKEQRFNLTFRNIIPSIQGRKASQTWEKLIERGVVRLYDPRIE